MDNSASLICVETGLLIEVSASGGETNWYDVDEKFTMGFSVGNDVTVTWNEIVTSPSCYSSDIYTVHWICTTLKNSINRKCLQ